MITGSIKEKFWNIFTSKEEYISDLSDQYGRFNYSFSKNREVFSPVVSEFIFKNGFRPQYPGNADFAVVFSHDVDLIFRNKKIFPGRFQRIALMLKGQQKQPFERIIPKEWDLNNMIEMEMKNKFISTFFFMALAEGDQDYNYEVNEVGNTIQNLLNSGCEIGLHGGHKAYNNIENNLLEKRRLNLVLPTEVKGYRNHYLRFDIQKTFSILLKNGFDYDSTFGYADCVGFRNGMCYPFQPFDLNRNEFIDIIEVPLVVMDVSMFYYMSLSSFQAFQICQRLTEEVKKVNGVLTVLLHNSNFDNKMLDFYNKFVDYIKCENAWFTTTGNLVDWWKGKEYHLQINDIVLQLK